VSQQSERVDHFGCLSAWSFIDGGTIPVV